MLRVEDVLTATPVVLEKVPKEFKLSEKANGIIQGLNASCMSIDGYTLDNIAVKLPRNTKEGSEHDLLMTQTVTKVAGAIAESLKIIKEYVIPSCDLIEKKIKEIGTIATLKDLIYAKLLLKFYNVPNTFFDSPLFPDQPDNDYGKGVLFSINNFTGLGSWPEKTYEEIIDLVSPASAFPELQAALQDQNSVLKAWKSLGNIPYWLNLSGIDIDARRVNTGIGSINTLIVLALIINKLSLDENPYPGVTNVSLDNYRLYLSRIKRFLETLLCYAKQRLTSSLANGLYLETSNIKLEVCTDNKSQFFGGEVLSGDVCVVYNDTIADFISNSDEYSLTSIVTGMLYADAKGMKAPAGDLISNFKFYKDVETQYSEPLKTKVIVNARNSAESKINVALNELANSAHWSDYLSEDGKYTNLTYRLEDLVKMNGGFLSQLLVDSVINDIRTDKLKVANTVVAPVLADVLGAPIAAEILRDNISNNQMSAEKQRKQLGKAVAKIVAKKLLALK